MQGPSTTFIYLVVVFGLLVVPRAPQRFRLPAPLTCFAFGIVFVSGLVTRSLNKRMATLASAENLDAIGLFASFFIPEVPTAALVSAFLLYGFLIAACVIPVRLGVVWLQSRFMQHRWHRGTFRVAIALTPTLIFTLVIAELLRDNFAISPQLYGGLLVYAAIASILPSLTLPAFAETSVDPIPIEA